MYGTVDSFSRNTIRGQKRRKTYEKVYEKQMFLNKKK